MQVKFRRLVFLAIIGFTLGLVAFVHFYFWRYRPVGSGPAGPSLSREEFSSTWTERRILLVGLGDSVTAGFGARRGYSYFDRLIANPPDEFQDMAGICLGAVLPKLQFTNMAVSGSTSFDHIKTQLPRLAKVDSNVFGIIVITTGGNDLIHNYGRTPPREHAMYGATLEQAKLWIEDFQQRLEAITGEIESRFPGGCNIFLANIYDPTDGIGDVEHAGLPAWKDGMKILDAYNDTIQLCAEKHRNVHLVDIHSVFLGHGIHCRQFWLKHYDSKDAHYWYYENFEDPNERGYDVIRRLFIVEIAKAFQEK